MHGKKHARKLRRFLQVSNIPSDDTIETVMEMVDSPLLLHIHQTECNRMQQDANQTIERTAALNLNIIRKWVLALVRNLDIEEDASFNLMEYSVNCDPTPMLKMLTAN